MKLWPEEVMAVVHDPVDTELITYVAAANNNMQISLKN